MKTDPVFPYTVTFDKLDYDLFMSIILVQMSEFREQENRIAFDEMIVYIDQFNRNNPNWDAHKYYTDKFNEIERQTNSPIPN